MKLTCEECESELEFTDLHEDGTELIIKPCKSCMDFIYSTAYDSGYDAGLENCGCTEYDYEEGYDEGYVDGKAEMEAEIDNLKDEIEELKNA